MRFSGFEWDEGNWPKCGKHGVTREEIEHLFASARVAPDLMHSQQETRYIAVGRNQSGRAMFVAFAIKQAQGGLHRIRPKAHALCMKRKYNGMKKIPTLTTDQQAEAFLDQDLSDLDFSQFKTMRLEFAPKSAALHLRLPEALLEGLKVRAKAQGVPYTRYVRMLLENDLAKGHS